MVKRINNTIRNYLLAITITALPQTENIWKGKGNIVYLSVVLEGVPLGRFHPPRSLVVVMAHEQPSHSFRSHWCFRLPWRRKPMLAPVCCLLLELLHRALSAIGVTTMSFAWGGRSIAAPWGGGAAHRLASTHHGSTVPAVLDGDSRDYGCRGCYAF